LAGNAIGRCVRLRAGTVRGVERWKSHRDEARNSRHSRLSLVGVVHETLLDRALWRRFDEVVRFEMPDPDQIQRLVTLKLSGIRRNLELDDAQVASLFMGMSHADIERVLRRAVRNMVLSGREILEISDLDKALAREHRREN